MVSIVPAKTFTVELERVQKTATMFRIPFDLADAFGRARPPVKVTIRGHTWRTTPGIYDGAGALAADPPVKKAFASLLFTHQREYVEWVEEAKRPETRARRISATVERVREGVTR